MKKVGIFESEITMSMPPSRKITKEEALPSPFDSMYMSPIIDIKGHTPVTNLRGEIIPEKKKKNEII